MTLLKEQTIPLGKLCQNNAVKRLTRMKCLTFEALILLRAAYAIT